MTAATHTHQQKHSQPSETGFKLRQFIDEVLSRLNVENVYTHPSHQFKVSGNKHRGGCLFHNSSSGSSFVVSKDSLLFWCAGCNHGGSALDYLYSRKVGRWSKPRGLDFIETVKQAAEMVGMSLPPRELSLEEIETARKWESRRAILQAVAEYGQQVLWSERGTAARQYLTQERGLTEEGIRDLGLGLYLSTEEVREALISKHCNLEDAKDAGVIWSKLEGYILFPWLDSRGRPLTIYGRYHTKTPPEGKPKTIALPGSGTKGSPLYFDRVLKAGHKDIVLVEGVLDAALLQISGDTRVCAYVAASCSEQQIESLKRHCIESVTLCGDPDAGGENGTHSNVERISKVGITVYVAPKLPDGLDPDEFLIREGMDGWNRHIASAIHGYTYKARCISSAFGSNGNLNDRHKHTILQRAIAFAKTVNNAEGRLTLETFFWPTICESLGMDLEEVRRQLEEVYQQSKAGSSDFVDNHTSKVVELRSAQQQPKTPETKEQRHARLIKALAEIDGETRASLREFAYELLAKEEGFTKRALKDIWRQECLDKPIQNLDLHDLLLAPPKSKEWVIEGLLELSRVYLLAAQAKTGKTPLINDWAYSVVTGTPWADRFPVSIPGRVLCIQSDENIEHTKQSLFLRGFGSKDVLGNIQIPHGNVRFISDFSAAQYPNLKKILQEYRPRLLLIDSLTTIGAGLPYDQNSPEFAAEVLYPLTRMIGELGDCSCVITHHTNKAPTELSVDRVAGSGRITAAVDEIWALERVDSKNLSDTRRYFSWLGGHGCGLGEPFDLQLTLNLEDLTFSVDGQVLNRKAETEAERLKPILQGDFQSNKDLILKYLQQRGGINGWSIQIIAADLNLSIGVARRDTLKLYTQGSIQRRRMECLGKGRPAYLYYYDSPEKKSPCAKNAVENSQNVDPVSDTNKDRPPDIKDQAGGVIFNPTPPDLKAEALPDKASRFFPQATEQKDIFSPTEETEQKPPAPVVEELEPKPAIAPTEPQQPAAKSGGLKAGDTIYVRCLVNGFLREGTCEKGVVVMMGKKLNEPHLAVHLESGLFLGFDEVDILPMPPSVATSDHNPSPFADTADAATLRPATEEQSLKVGDRVALADPYLVAHNYHGIVELVAEDEALIRWEERQGKANECEIYSASELRRLE